MPDFIAQQSITIRTTPTRVWEALTDPKLIKQYLFGTVVETDWQVGSSITYRGVWENKQYEDKGVILNVVPEKLLATTYWSSLSGTLDSPENYQHVTYELAGEDGQTTLTITQDGNGTAEAKTHSEQNWARVLADLKRILER